MALSLLASVNSAFFTIRPVAGAFPGANGKIAYVALAQHQQGWAIWSMWPNGASQMQLTHILDEFVHGPVWSADGSKIVFFTLAGRLPGSGSPSRIYVMNSDGTGLKQLTNDGWWPAWSPDGTKIVFASYRTANGVVQVAGNLLAQIWVMNSDGTNPKQLTNTGNNWEPRWSPDGKKIAYVSDRAKNGLTHNIYVMNADGTGQMRLTGPSGDQYGPDWAPDGSKIVFWTRNSPISGRLLVNTGYIWVMNSDGSDAKLLNIDGLGPAWSPDGNKIVFEGVSQGEILVMNPDGSSVKELYHPAFGSAPNWQRVTPMFYLDDPPIYLSPGTSNSSEIVVNSIGGFSSPVSLSGSWVGTPPVGVDFYIPSPAVVTPSVDTGNATWPLTITASTDAMPGNYTLQVTGMSGSFSDSLNITVVVKSTTFIPTSMPSFEMFPCCFPDILPVPQGGNNSATINVDSLNGFTGQVTLTSSWIGTAPIDVSVSYSANTIGGTPVPSSLFTFTAGPNASMGTFMFEVNGTSQSLTHTVDIPVQVTGAPSTGAPDFSIDSSNSTVYVTQGSNGTVGAITVTPVNEFNSTVELSWSWLGTPPAGVFPVWEANRNVFLYPENWISPELRVTTYPNATVGNFTLRITGTKGSLSHSVDISILVIPLSTTTAVATTAISTTATAPPPPPKCLIATATYGSELSPEVQLLRNFRDNSILKTQAGSSFMVAFNAWYYSFSPYVANYITNHWVERTIMKGVLYPLIGILALTSATFSATSAFPEFAALLSGLVASSLIGAFYLGLPLSLIRARVRRLRGVGAQGLVLKLLTAGLLGGVVVLMLGEIFASSFALMTSSAAIVLSTLFLSAAVTAAKVAKRL